MFYFYKHLIQLRKEVDVITTGDYTDLYPEHDSIFGYRRQSDTQTLICLNNYYNTEAECVLPEDFELINAKVLLSNYETGIKLNRHIIMRPYETLTLLCETR